MIRRPPRSTLFPTRRSSDLEEAAKAFTAKLRVFKRATSLGSVESLAEHRASVRSEEHTSELQSQSNLVCRLLLEKKKKDHISSLLATREQVRTSELASVSR